MRHLVLGAGEVGTALAAVLTRHHDTLLRDVEPVPLSVDVIHVAIPWSATFVESVHAAARYHSASRVVVHSTVPVGTCDPHGWVHSPVRGRHPHLVEGLTTFVKHFGGHGAESEAEVFDACGIRVQTHEQAADTESAKLWELVQFGLQVVVEKQIHHWCSVNGRDFATVYTAFAETYNDGYRRLGHEQFVRPVLEHMPGPIGGHCVQEMAALLDHPLAEMVTRA